MKPQDEWNSRRSSLVMKSRAGDEVTNPELLDHLIFLAGCEGGMMTVEVDGARADVLQRMSEPPVDGVCQHCDEKLEPEGPNCADDHEGHCCYSCYREFQREGFPG